MKFYEAPDFKRIVFATDDVLADGSIIDPNGTDNNGKPGSIYEVGEIPLFK